MRIPGDTGSQFDMPDLSGKGPDSFLRINAIWNINEKHRFRFVIIPLETGAIGNLCQPTQFAAESFSAVLINSTAISSFTVTPFFSNESWRCRVGCTGLIRAANIALEQENRRQMTIRYVLYQLLDLYGEYKLSPGTASYLILMG
jgi:hypothetical protein